MGTESSCTLRTGAETWTGTALLETEEILFRYTDSAKKRLRIPFKEIERVEAAKGALVVTTRDAKTFRLELGRAAEAWAAKVKSPPSRLKKLGVTASTEIAFVGALDEVFVAEATAVARSTKPERAAIVFLAAESKAQLAKIATLRAKLRDDGAIWIVYPKGQKHIRELDVLSAGRDAGLKDVKVAKFSETHTALKFVVPVADRRR
jgi:hypothetical protein